MLQRCTTALTRCHHPLVRDLAWMSQAPDLIDTAYPGRPSREQLGLADDACFDDLLTALEAVPSRWSDGSVLP